MRLSSFLKLILLTAVGVAVVSGCASRRNQLAMSSGPEELYALGTDAMAGADWSTALGYFQTLEARYPFSNLARQAQLDMIYLYFRARRPAEAVDAAEEFEAENPTHPRVDYCLYMKGLIHFDQAPNFLERMFRVDMSERPPRDTLQAFASFQELLARFPESEYAPDARERMIFLRNRLADYENHVANYYIERGAYVAAVNRAKYALEHYPGAPAMQDSLFILAQAYSLLGMPDLAADAQRVLEINFGVEPQPPPDSQVEIFEVAEATESETPEDPGG